MLSVVDRKACHLAYAVVGKGRTYFIQQMYSTPKLMLFPNSKIHTYRREYAKTYAVFVLVYFRGAFTTKKSA